MALKSKRCKCKHCGKLFRPDPRSAGRQRYCSEPQCRKASKAASQRRWIEKPENRDYFRGPDNVRRVQRWRKAHPGYWGKRPHALQDQLTAQPVENKDDAVRFANTALQDSLIMQPSVLIGLIAQLTGSALQDDIAMAARRMQQLGNDILNPNTGGGHGRKTSHLPPTYPQGAPPVQLDRPAPGP